MVVTCIANSSKHNPVLFQPLGYSEKAGFQVTPGVEYVVHAMGLMGLHLVLLLRDDTGQPGWFPALQFKVANPHLSSDWKYDINRRDGRGLRAIWGYREIVEDQRHNDGLIARDPAAVQVFQRAAEKMPLQAAMAL